LQLSAVNDNMHKSYTKKFTVMINRELEMRTLLLISFVVIKCAQKVHPFSPLCLPQGVEGSSQYISKQVMDSCYQVLLIPGCGLFGKDKQPFT
jgi:hypothetical protein